MIGSEMARERIADRIREAESERRSRPISEARAVERRSRLRALFGAAARRLVPRERVLRRRRAVDPVL
jgi:hypothetical protein